VTIGETVAEIYRCGIFGGSRHIVLVKFDVFTIGTVKNVEQRHCANFGRTRSKHFGDTSLIHFSRWELPPSSLSGLSTRSKCIIVLNFVKIRQTAAHIWLLLIFFKMAAAVVFYFRHFKFLTIGTVERVELHHHSKFLQNGSNRGSHITISKVFQHVARPPSWIVNACVGTTHERHLLVFMTVQNFVGIYAVVFRNCHLQLT